MIASWLPKWFNLSWRDPAKVREELVRREADQGLLKQAHDQRHQIACDISPILVELQSDSKLKDRVGSDAIDEWLQTRAEVHACLKNYMPAQ